MDTTSTPPPIFSGEVRHSIDGKNRVTIPSRWRRTDADVFVLAPDRKGECLRAMSPATFRKAGERAAETAGVTRADYAAFERQFFARSETVTADKQGRLVLPEQYCRTLKLDGDVVLVGTNEGFQIWNPEAWSRTKEADEAAFARVADLIGW